MLLKMLCFLFLVIFVFVKKNCFCVWNFNFYCSAVALLYVCRPKLAYLSYHVLRRILLDGEYFYLRYFLLVTIFIGQPNCTELLCTLVRLYKETPLPPLWLRSTIPYIPDQFYFGQLSLFPFPNFLRQDKRTIGKTWFP